MANTHAIDAISSSLIGLLEDARPTEFLTSKVELYQASDFIKSPASTLSIYLYRVAFNPAGRTRAFRLGTDGKRYRPALPLDLFFMLTAWSKTDTKQQQHLLAWAARVFDDFPVLPSSVLNHYANTPSFQPEESVELTPEFVTQEQLVSIWEVGKQNQQPSLVYVARCVPIDSETELIEAGLTQTRDFAYGVLEPAGAR